MNQENQLAPATSNDGELVARAQRGEEQAFEALFHAHKRRVYYLCLRMIGNKAEAEELTQEAFMQAFRKIQTFRGDAAFSTWLHRVSVNVVLMRLRKKTPTEIVVENGEEDEKNDRRQREFGGPDLVLTGLVDRVCLEQAIEKLPPGYKRVFVLHDVMGCEHNEIAATLGYSIGNSKSQLHKARLRLRKLLGAGLRATAHRTKTPSRVASAPASGDAPSRAHRQPSTVHDCSAVLEAETDQECVAAEIR